MASKNCWRLQSTLAKNFQDENYHWRAKSYYCHSRNAFLIFFLMHWRDFGTISMKKKRSMTPFKEVSIRSSYYQRHSGEGQGSPVCGVHWHHEGPHLIHLTKMAACGYPTLPLVHWEGVQGNPYWHISPVLYYIFSCRSGTIQQSCQTRS